jgi:hypothetical protein
MIQIDLKKIPWSFDMKTSEKGIIVISEKDVRFGTEYEVVSPTGNKKTFTFTHSTGPEFAPETKWMYKSEDGLQLAVCNDAKMVKIAAENYLNAKLQKV